MEKQRRSSDILSKGLNNQQRGLHTVNEEDYYQRKSFREIDSCVIQRKQRSSVTHFNNFPLQQQQVSPAEEQRKTRADVLAETEAKLSGHNRYAQLDVPIKEKQSRRLSEPTHTRTHNQHHTNYLDDHHRHPSSYSTKRMSFQQLELEKRNSSSSGRQQSRPNSTVGLLNNHRFSTGSSNLFENNNNNNNNQRKPLFTSHLPFSSVVPHLKSNHLVSGLLRVNKRNRSDAYVFCEDINADIYICGSRDRNRALEGDHVAIRLIEVDQVMLEKHEKEEAKLARNNGNPVQRKPDEEDEKEIIFGGEEDVDLVTPRYCGVVVAILERAQKQVFSG